MQERRYLVVIDGEEPFIATVKDDVNRPNNVDCEDVLHEYVSNNFGQVYFDGYGVYELDSYKLIQL